jgi:hypothetical protein
VRVIFAYLPVAMNIMFIEDDSAMLSRLCTVVTTSVINSKQLAADHHDAELPVEQQYFNKVRMSMSKPLLLEPSSPSPDYIITTSSQRSHDPELSWLHPRDWV